VKSPSNKGKNMKLPKILSIAITTACASITAMPNAVSAAEFEWKFFTYFVTNSSAAAINREFAKDVTNNSDGRLKIEVFSAGELPFKASDVVKAVATNKVQMGDAAVGFVAGDVPELNIFSIPFVCTNFDGFENSLPSIEPIIRNQMSEKFGINVLMNWPMPPQNIWTVEPIASVSELEGRKIRAWNPLQVEMLGKLSAAAISMSGSEVPTALQTKVIEGAITSALSVADWKISESVRGGLVTDFSLGHQFTLVNQEAFDELPKDLQQLLGVKAKEYQSRFSAAMELADATARATLTSDGMILTQMTADDAKFAQQLMAPMAEKWVSENGAVAAELLKNVRANCGV
jgi:TRAP-type C4-dicarboxylate transport system substrate-binding protein